ncbi:MAG: hypothetical protein ABEI74_01020 [Candidatus Pacearchaeota archaeon]
MGEDVKEIKKQRIEKVKNLYYSRKDVQEAIFDFSDKREISPQYFEGFGKRPDTFQYLTDVFGMVQKGATSFHCSEELWKDPMSIYTGMDEEEANELREGWDLLIDIDCKYFDYSKKAAQSILQVFKNHGIKNYGIKFSGSKGFHIIVPWKAFPKEITGEETRKLFPELPRKLVAYIGARAERIIPYLLPKDIYDQFEGYEINRGIKCQNCRNIAEEYEFISYYCPKCKREEFKKLKKDSKKNFKCPDCRQNFEVADSETVYVCSDCGLDSRKNPDNFSRHSEIDFFELMGLDLVMVSPRHLFRMPYSLHEKTALASVVINEEELEDFTPKDADPLKADVKSFMPEAEEEEATEFVMQALDWYEASGEEFSESENKKSDFSPVKVENVKYENFPPTIKKILEGLSDGKKRALFILINLFKSIGMEKQEIEQRIHDWNKNNDKPLRQGYIKAQLNWSDRNKIVPPPNFDKEYYKGIGVNPTDEELKLKNPVNYILKKTFGSQGQKGKGSKKKSASKKKSIKKSSSDKDSGYHGK